MIENIDKSKSKADFKNTEIKMANDDFAFCTKPIKIKDLWYNAILQKPQPTKKSNIQFIMRCNLTGTQTSYIVVSKEPMTLEEINKINLNDIL